jgi:DNA invertase Pin-like site-specific DNA recombinase
MKATQPEAQPLNFYRLLRVSSEGQKDRYGLPVQERATEDFVARLPNGPHGIADTAVVVESAGGWIRQDWANAISEGLRRFRNGEVNAFLLPRVDRETRNLFASIPLLKEVLDAGIPVYFAEEDICLTPSDPDAIQKYFESAMGAAAYLRTLVKNTRGGRLARARDYQKHPTNRVMFGFDLIDGKRIPKPAEAHALCEAAQVALKAGRSSPAAAYLNDLGFLTTNGKPFVAASLTGKRGLFRNRALIGETTINFKEESVVLHHEGILDRTTFDQLQALMEERRLRAPRSMVFFALSGIAFCSCGSRLEGKTSKQYRYYRCNKGCGHKMWRKDALESETYRNFISYLEGKEGQQQYLELAQQSRAKLGKQLRDIEARMAPNDREWRVLLDQALAEWPEIIINDKKRALKAERESLLQAHAKIEAQLAMLPTVDPDELERALAELHKPFIMANQGGYDMPYPMCWGLTVENDGRLTDLKLKLLREILLKLNCRVTVYSDLNYGVPAYGPMVPVHQDVVTISGRLPICIGAKEGGS